VNYSIHFTLNDHVFQYNNNITSVRVLYLYCTICIFSNDMNNDELSWLLLLSRKDCRKQMLCKPEMYRKTVYVTNLIYKLRHRLSRVFKK